MTIAPTSSSSRAERRAAAGRSRAERRAAAGRFRQRGLGERLFLLLLGPVTVAVLLWRFVSAVPRVRFDDAVLCLLDVAPPRTLGAPLWPAHAWTAAACSPADGTATVSSAALPFRLAELLTPFVTGAAGLDVRLAAAVIALVLAVVVVAGTLAVPGRLVVRVGAAVLAVGALVDPWSVRTLLAAGPESAALLGAAATAVSAAWLPRRPFVATAAITVSAASWVTAAPTLAWVVLPVVTAVVVVVVVRATGVDRVVGLAVAGAAVAALVTSAWTGAHLASPDDGVDARTRHVQVVASVIGSDAARATFGLGPGTGDGSIRDGDPDPAFATLDDLDLVRAAVVHPATTVVLADRAVSALLDPDVDSPDTGASPVTVAAGALASLPLLALGLHLAVAASAAALTVRRRLGSRASGVGIAALVMTSSSWLVFWAWVVTGDPADPVPAVVFTTTTLALVPLLPVQLAVLLRSGPAVAGRQRHRRLVLTTARTGAHR
ncbi:hypothetical protein DEJ13_12125 [Curtobacterium sp. MCLR17_007]|uniref:hypothetical protein n=1 Tax=Curtobacterium sp. MCLR17_007 TaxID=2175648 RepID=UPI0011B72475|nr:hypothetical protein [Curtobacterium sp. MCLR17_007]WIB59196.1 hypothetical protein DEJ13_12125 [Curtobacterium sp. MCLR17_007]